MRIGLRGIGTVDGLIASDPGLVQLRVASGKVLSLGISLAVLYGFTKLACQPFTVALLSVLIPMIASMAPLQQLATAALMLAVTGTAVTLGAWLVSDKVAADVVIVVIIAATTFAQRCSSRAANLGLAGFMTYLVARSAGATFAQLPWLISALAIGTAVSLATGPP
jgi:hypothetical protein